jgi:hypothetical protein
LRSVAGTPCTSLRDSRRDGGDLAAVGDGTRIALFSHVRALSPTTVKRARPEAVTAVELVWTVPPPVSPLPRPRAGVMATPLGLAPLPTMHDLAEVSRAIAAEQTFTAAARRLELEARRMTRSTEALCVAFDWARRVAWSAQGPIGNQAVVDLVAQVAGSGRWSMIGNALVVPIGGAPARAVIALRRIGTYQLAEAGLVSALAGGIAPAIERLLANERP